ncbi:chemotaxis response regulator protein-glutamate methylesterase [Roseivivax sp. THAF30]|uniref:protein-glutamate methylesterase/protein-glutamine glutaminase n=1 Tax=Roseivivax sp. THAF30 TaxID=2587852 RepID=UPI00126925F1|nr:chemotaxis response regulator protein-glutamate methylesterase [Roseivivax sp. THAF30]QFT64569.1 Chemotaxis response regulator protein-glutamate methylesterase of group 3 operon [Roseivivax sp. THAF30]
MAPIRVFIVDDSASARRALSDLLGGDPGIVVVGTATDPFDAASKMRAELPDVLLLDLELPRMDGLTFLRKIMAQHPLPVIICSSHTESGSRAALKALEIGACDVIGKPDLSTRAAREEAQVLLCDVVRAAAQIRSRTGPGRNAGRGGKTAGPFSAGPKLTADAMLPPLLPGHRAPANMQRMIAIGASTGGTEALARLLPGLAPDMPPVVIVQHMPEKFTTAFAARLDGLCSVQVREARNGDRAEVGTVLVAPGNRHLLVQRQGRGYRIEIREGPQVSRHRPSVDVLFRSVASASGGAAIGCLMTGMGDDGARGLSEMRGVGARTLIQDEASSVVWGMPGEAHKLGAAEQIVPLNRLAVELRRLSFEKGAA